MLQIVEVLLYLQLIAGNGPVPSADQINGLAQDNQQTITQILSDGNLMPQIDNQYHDQAQGIVIIDYDEGTK